MLFFMSKVTGLQVKGKKFAVLLTSYKVAYTTKASLSSINNIYVKVNFIRSISYQSLDIILMHMQFPPTRQPFSSVFFSFFSKNNFKLHKSYTDRFSDKAKVLLPLPLPSFCCQFGKLPSRGFSTDYILGNVPVYKRVTMCFAVYINRIHTVRN